MILRDIIKLSFFLFTSIGLFYLSRGSLRLPLTHGLPRLFAWEAILVLFISNVQYWFRDPFSVFQILSWILLMISLGMILSGSWFLYVAGKPDESREGDALLGIEKTSVLVTTGVYRYIRHPFYSSLLFLAWGIFFKRLNWLGLFAAIFVSLCLFITAIIEEYEDIVFFGTSYRSYMEQTKKFLPFIF